MNPNLLVAIYFVACVVGGLFRVWRKFGRKGFATPKFVVDAIFSSASGVIFPYVVSAIAPAVLVEKIPILAWALALAALTYWTNNFFINRLKSVFGYTNAPGDEDLNGQPAPPAPGGSVGDGVPPPPPPASTNTGG